jgi:hypothetical protein
VAVGLMSDISAVVQSDSAPVRRARWLQLDWLSLV